MWESAIVAYLHYASFMLAYGALAIEGFTLKQDISLSEGWRIAIADALYGLAAVVVLVTGILRVLYFGKGSEFYLQNPVFYIKIGLFVVVGLLSLYPTVSFLKWFPDLRQGKAPSLDLPKVNRLLWMIRIELVGFILIPLFAAIMARGLYLPPGSGLF